MARILVADPDADLREAIRRALEMEGHVVDEAGSIADVLTRAGTADVHMVLIEAIFPDGSGNDVCRGLRASGFDAPIVIVSAYNQWERRRALDAGADDYIIKPFGLRGLLKTVDKHLQGSL